MVMQRPALFNSQVFSQKFMKMRSSSKLSLEPVSLTSEVSFEHKQSPSEIYGDLFSRVQLARLFPDSKTFADAIPKRAIDVILSAFKAENPTDDVELLGFVKSNFVIPKATALDIESSFDQDISNHISGLWARLERQTQSVPDESSALSLPFSYIVPGGRFREIYYWDSYFTMLGLKIDGRDDLVEAIIRNFVSLIERFGHIPNGTRSYYLSRSQPPFLSLMIGLVKANSLYENQRYLEALQSEYRYWMAGSETLDHHNTSCASVVMLPDGAILNRYWDDLDTPRDEAYAEDVETAKSSNRPSAQVYRDLRAGAASGWDFSSRWLQESKDFSTIQTTNIIPIDLNALLWLLETTIAQYSRNMGRADTSQTYETLAARRAQAMRRHLWHASEGRFGDYNIASGEITPIISAASLYPLFVGFATQDEAKATISLTQNVLIARGGVRTTTTTTEQQWDMPNGWAPLQWIAIEGFERYGYCALARDIASRWLKTVSHSFAQIGMLMEKYDIEDLRPGSGGEYPVQIGFGWTNGVTRALIHRYPDIALN